ncbi:hypothetical protein CBOM_01919 [Ceraceosorus bombacis]|uniref:Uncharacterized protein n=1 Tax=Ceraceosorus bombacis TaxID=401625 RepID=A0A0P1BDZ8_9BASI|nr:hypothetical protein CBOM_01919 [Ceraceosorus bombacis]
MPGRALSPIWVLMPRRRKHVRKPSLSESRKFMDVKEKIKVVKEDVMKAMKEVALIVYSP